jgi:hypothetical protein
VVATEMAKTNRKPVGATTPEVTDPTETPPATAEPVTTYKIYRRDARLLSKIGSMLDMAQPDTIAHFRREFENLWETLITREQARLKGKQ